MSHSRLLPLLAVVVLTFASSSSLGHAPQTSASGNNAAPEMVSSIDVLVDRLERPLTLAGKSALVEYNGACTKRGDEHPVSFPPTELQDPPENAKGLAAIQAMFRNDRNVAVVKAEDDTIVINVGNVWAAILDTKISLISLSDDGQYTSALAISAMLGTKEMQIAAEKHHARYPVLIEALSSVGGKGQPHLPPVIENITAAGFLRLVAKTFKGIVIYSECQEPNGWHLIDIVSPDSNSVSIWPE